GLKSGFGMRKNLEKRCQNSICSAIIIYIPILHTPETRFLDEAGFPHGSKTEFSAETGFFIPRVGE
ncbi:MAG TPA: hypothetical protein DDW56_19635, partial [Cyanobacteria bacterium UBA11366]|nr:hypothetical protein [Cyanobacteria bacterium UBA11366]